MVRNTHHPQSAARLALLGLLWISCNQAAGIREGKPYPDACKTSADCDQGVPECRVASCQDERCVYLDVPEGTRLSNQITGDCLEEQCDGKGRTRKVAVESDIEDDGQPCTADTCVGTEPRHTPLSSTPCYSGAPGTELLGNCRAGRQACKDGKPVGACIGERVPTAETCQTIYDDDCDGNVNEEGLGCVCIPGSIVACYPGKQENLGYGACAAGTQACNALGTAYNACQDFTGPLPEVCDPQELDDDCDGMINEEGADCKCGDGFVSGTEVCDDANTVDTDGCSTLCQIPGCGNGSKETNETCDDGNIDNFDACTNQCQEATCGDGVVHFDFEECDDANSNDFDACTSQCTWNKCILNEVVCTPLNDCHIAGTCDPFTGLCADSLVPNGTVCNDGVECTDAVCMDGTCLGAQSPNGSDCTCGKCNAGACTAKLLGSTADVMGIARPWSLAVSGNQLYFSNSYGGLVGQASIGVIDLVTLQKQSLVPGLSGYPLLRVEGDKIYYALGMLLAFVPKAGGMPMQVDTAPLFDGLTSDGVNIYATDSFSDTVTAYSLANGMRTPLATKENKAAHIVSNGTNVYWINENVRVRTVPITGGTPTTLVLDQSNVYRIAVDATNIYWTDTITNTVNKMPLAGGTPTILATDMLQPRNIAVTNGHVYWTNFAGGANNAAFIQKIPIAGNMSPVIIPPYGTTPDHIVYDAQCIYWHDLYGAVYSAPQ